ncbi:hypothetical protein [Acinetobacter pittii]|uniref:Uncharacterized protein n=1 Tax=Acinetobacter pittii TaxID=48296 RepID=A0A6H0G0E3_ACIPI|nr:hypothetical protein [Acinetobacter pittii]QIT20018.1 hypothetical protein G8E09_19605 [Acinetobacter pittii]
MSSKFDRYNDKVKPYTFRLNTESDKAKKVIEYLDSLKSKKEFSPYVLGLIEKDLQEKGLI